MTRELNDQPVDTWTVQQCTDGFINLVGLSCSTNLAFITRLGPRYVRRSDLCNANNALITLNDLCVVAAAHARRPVGNLLFWRVSQCGIGRCQHTRVLNIVHPSQPEITP